MELRCHLLLAPWGPRPSILWMTAICPSQAGSGAGDSGMTVQSSAWGPAQGTVRTSLRYAAPGDDVAPPLGGACLDLQSL